MPFHILVAEADMLTALRIDEALTEAGYKVTLSRTPEQAHAVLLLEPVNFLVVGHSSQLDGERLIQIARDLDPDLSIAVVTNRTGLRFAEKTTILMKPILVADLIAVIETEIGTPPRARSIAAWALNDVTRRRAGGPVRIR